MPLIKVNGIDIMYEAFGKGPTVFWLQAAGGGRNPGAYFIAGRLSIKYRVIIWDSPNYGLSGHIIKNTPSQWHLDCEYIYGLCKALGETSVYFAGGSGGGELALLMAHLFPEIVKGIIMYRPTDTSKGPERDIVQAMYYDLEQVAKRGTMKDVIEYSSNPPKSRWSELSKWVYNLAQNPNTKEYLLSFEPKEFSAIMKNWGDWMSNPGFYKVNLDDEILKSIKMPVLICPAPDPYHTEEIARDLYNKLPNAKLVPCSVFRNEDEMYGAPGEEHHFGGFIDLIPIMEEFLMEG